MFDPSDTPRVFGVSCGADFARSLIDGVIERTQNMPPEALARVRILVNTRRMARRIGELFNQGPALLLPRIGLVTDLTEMIPPGILPAPVPALRRQLELMRLVSHLIEHQPGLAPRSSVFDLAHSLAALMSEMQYEGVSLDTLASLDVSDQSGHWERIKTFLDILRPYFETARAEPDQETHQRLGSEWLEREWAQNPPGDPIIIAGSTGSRGATRLLMRAVAKQASGAVILPGVDDNTPEKVWDVMSDALRFEDHPQFRFKQFLAELGMSPADVAPWRNETVPAPARNRVVSLALRPAPVTDQWLVEGPSHKRLEEAFETVTMLEAPSVRLEAMAIALRLRKAAEDGQAAALITPDRGLTRRVAAALDRWGIVPDDSAGTPLHQTAPGRFLRQLADLGTGPLTNGRLIALLKHPLCHSTQERGIHLRLTRDLEHYLRGKGTPTPEIDDILHWAEIHKSDRVKVWSTWLCTCLDRASQPDDPRPLVKRTDDFIALAETLARGPAPEGAGELWQKDAGKVAWSALNEIRAHAEHGADMSARDFTGFLYRILALREVRMAVTPHAHILIWGTIEARVQGVDLVILGSLNEGSWPDVNTPDPWLNRAMRHRAGLLLPERRIGLAAHDFQQAMAAREVWMTRSVRSDDAERVVSRWWNRLQNLLGGLKAQGGMAALNAMRARGAYWLDQVGAYEAPVHVPSARRPSPCPPVHQRPKRLTVTEIKNLIRDPYAIYARRVLNLKKLNPLTPSADFLLRGIALHEVFERYIKQSVAQPDLLTQEALMAVAHDVLATKVPWPAARLFWQARVERVAPWFLEREIERRQHAVPVAFEATSSAEIPDLGFRLEGRADRIDIDHSGHIHLIDYKSGQPPSTNEQIHFDRQLLLEAAMAERTGFGDLSALTVARATFIGFAKSGTEVEAPIDVESPENVWTEFVALITAYHQPDVGYTSRRALHSKDDSRDYDQLARFGEWDITAPPDKVYL